MIFRLTLSFGLLITGPIWAKDLFVQSLKAPLLSEAKNGAKVLDTLDRGTQVQEVKSVDRFVEIKSPNGAGFINKLFVSDKPVGEKKSLLSKDVDISSKARKRASGFTSAAAARGLKEDSDDIFSDLGDANEVALKEMEKQKIENDVGVQFLTDMKAVIP